MRGSMVGTPLVAFSVLRGSNFLVFGFTQKKCVYCAYSGTDASLAEARYG